MSEILTGLLGVWSFIGFIKTLKWLNLILKKIQLRLIKVKQVSKPHKKSKIVISDGNTKLKSEFE